jgi:hypothetical protein
VPDRRFGHGRLEVGLRARLDQHSWPQRKRAKTLVPQSYSAFDLLRQRCLGQAPEEVPQLVNRAARAQSGRDARLLEPIGRQPAALFEHEVVFRLEQRA